MANKTQCSDGTWITDATAKSRYSKALKKKHEGRSGSVVCAGCELARAEHNDHTIAKARCKQIGKTELIYHPDNFEDSCPVCHHEWESYKSGNWINHKNVAKRLAFLKEHDLEGYLKRIEFTTLALEREIS